MPATEAVMQEIAAIFEDYGTEPEQLVKICDEILRLELNKSTRISVERLQQAAHDRSRM